MQKLLFLRINTRLAGRAVSYKIHSTMSRIGKVTSLPRYYQLGYESSGFVLPESCIKDRIQMDLMLGSLDTISKYTPISQDVFLLRDARYISIDYIYYSLILRGICVVDLFTMNQYETHGEFSDYISGTKIRLSQAWRAKGYPIPEYYVCATHCVVDLDLCVADRDDKIRMKFQLCDTEVSLIKQRIRTPIDEKYYIIGVIEISDDNGRHFLSQLKWETEVQNERRDRECPGCIIS